MGQIGENSSATIDITLASLADGSGRQSDVIANPRRLTTAFVGVKVTTGTSPTADNTIKVYLLRRAAGISDDGFGDTDAAIAIASATLLGTITVTGTSDTTYNAVFDTATVGPLSSEWAIAIVNSSGVALNATGGNHSLAVAYYEAGPTWR